MLFLLKVYALADSSYSGNWTVPVLFDKVKNTIVSNESGEIIRMLNTEFNEFCATEEQKMLDLYPEDLRTEIDEINEWIYRYVNAAKRAATFCNAAIFLATCKCSIF